MTSRAETEKLRAPRAGGDALLVGWSPAPWPVRRGDADRRKSDRSPCSMRDLLLRPTETRLLWKSSEYDLGHAVFRFLRKQRVIWLFY
jgi:hypothetical protein